MKFYKAPSFYLFLISYGIAACGLFQNGNSYGAAFVLGAMIAMVATVCFIVFFACIGVDLY